LTTPETETLPETSSESRPETALDATREPLDENLATVQLADHASHEHDHTGHEHEHAPTLNPELTRTISVEAPAEDVEKAFRKVTKRFSGLARIPGFRAGKVPSSLIRSRFAKDIRQEVLDSLVSERFRAALEEQHLRPISQPQISQLQLVDGQPLRFQAAFEVLPEIDIEGYDSVQVQRPDTSVSEDEFQAELDNVLEHHATVEPVEEDRPLTDGDWAEIGFKGQVQDLAHVVGEEPVGEEGPEGKPASQPDQPITGEDVLIEIGGKNTLPAFNEALRGAKPGQELEFEATYPPEFGDARLAGKTVAYDVTVKAIKRKLFPERDEEFVKQLGPYENWDDFETKLRERVAQRKKDALESQARDHMLDEIIGRYNFPVPETFVQQQVDARLERGLRALAQQGMSSDAMRQLDFARLRDAQRDQAINEVKLSLVLDRIAERENIAVTDEDFERELFMLSIQAREPLETLRKRLADDGSLDRIREQMRREKTGTSLFERLAS
jgi:trigger factor